VDSLVHDSVDNGNKPTTRLLNDPNTHYNVYNEKDEEKHFGDDLDEDEGGDTGAAGDDRY
jgi:hypothetical protein